MKVRIKNQFLAVVLVAVLGAGLAGQVSAQTFTTLYNFTATSSPAYTNTDGTYPDAGLILSETSCMAQPMQAAVRPKGRCLPSAPMEQVSQTCIVSPGTQPTGLSRPPA